MILIEASSRVELNTRVIALAKLRKAKLIIDLAEDGKMKMKYEVGNADIAQVAEQSLRK